LLPRGDGSALPGADDDVTSMPRPLDGTRTKCCIEAGARCTDVAAANTLDDATAACLRVITVGRVRDTNRLHRSTSMHAHTCHTRTHHLASTALEVGVTDAARTNANARSRLACGRDDGSVCNVASRNCAKPQSVSAGGTRRCPRRVRSSCSNSDVDLTQRVTGRATAQPHRQPVNIRRNARCHQLHCTLAVSTCTSSPPHTQASQCEHIATQTHADALSRRSRRGVIIARRTVVDRRRWLVIMFA
jgi:hypothetical protein